MSFDLSLSDDQRAVEDLFATFLSDRCSPGVVVRAAEPLGFDASLWDGFAAIGAPGMAAPAETGGGGAGLVRARGRCRTSWPCRSPRCRSSSTRLPPGPFPMLTSSTGDVVATVALRPARRDGTWTLVPAGAVADVVVGLDGDELVAVRSEPPRTAP